MASLHQARPGGGTNDRRRAGLKQPHSLLGAISPGAQRLSFAEYALENCIDVLEVIAEIELLFDFGIRQVLFYICVFFQE
jgi:hypothetical protein